MGSKNKPQQQQGTGQQVFGYMEANVFLTPDSKDQTPFPLSVGQTPSKETQQIPQKRRREKSRVAQKRDHRSKTNFVKPTALQKKPDPRKIVFQQLNSNEIPKPKKTKPKNIQIKNANTQDKSTVLLLTKKQANGIFRYSVKFTGETLDFISEKDLPLNVELIVYKPLKVGTHFSCLEIESQ